MSVKMLVRQELPAPSLHLLENDVLERAQHELKYHHASTARYQLSLRDKASSIFKACGVQPFTAESVDRYKRMVHLKSRAWTWAGIVATFTFAIGLAVSGIQIANYVDPTNQTFVHFMICAAGFCGAIISTVVGLNKNDGFGKRWRMDQLEDFGGDVPAFALLTAMNIQREAYKVLNGSRPAFHVETFREQSVAEMRAADPFLVVRFGSDSYYVEVWDEPGFDRERKA